MDIRDAHTLKEENKLILQNETIVYTQKNQDINPISQIDGTCQCKKTSKCVNIANWLSCCGQLEMSKISKVYNNRPFKYS